MLKNGFARINFHHQKRGTRLNKISELKAFIESIFAREKKDFCLLNIVFCSDKYLIAINRKFLAHDFYTDIITFCLSETRESINGEIYISVDRVCDNAKKLNEYKSHELLRVIFHGVLHLCGFRDKSKEEKALMRQKENFYLNDFLKRST